MKVLSTNFNMPVIGSYKANKNKSVDEKVQSKSVEKFDMPCYKPAFAGDYQPSLFEQSPKYIKKPLNMAIDTFRNELSGQVSYSLAGKEVFDINPDELDVADAKKISYKLSNNAKKLFLDAFRKNDLEKIKEASKYFEKTIEILDSIEDKGVVSKAQKDVKHSRSINLAYCYVMLDKHNKLIELADKNAGYSMLEEIVGEHCFVKGDYQNAVKFLKNSIDNSAISRNQNALAVSQGRLGEAYLKSRKYNMATRQFKKALKCFSQNEEPKAKINRLMGEAYIGNRNYEKALGYLNQSFAYYASEGKDNSLATTLELMGRAYYKSEDYDNAINCYNAAIAGLTGDMKLAFVHQNLGDAYFQKNEPKKAIRHGFIGLNYYLSNPKSSINDHFVEVGLDRLRFANKFIKNKKLGTDIRSLSAVNQARLHSQVKDVLNEHYRMKVK